MIDRGSGTPVVLIPGIQGRWEWLAPTVDALANVCRVITFSLCDEPTSEFDFDPEHGFTDYLRQIEAALDRAHVPRAVVIGISYSGPIAAAFAARCPDRVSGLILVSALPPDWIPDRRARFYLRAPRLLSPMFAITSPMRLMPEIVAALPSRRQQIGFLAAQVRRAFQAFVSPARMASRIRYIANYAIDGLDAIDVPTLIVTGEDRLDRVVPAEVTRRYLPLLRGSRHVVFAGTGHIGVVTKPHEFATIVRQFAEDGSKHARRIPA